MAYSWFIVLLAISATALLLFTAAWNSSWPSSARTNPAPATAPAVCGCGKFLSNVCWSSGGSVRSRAQHPPFHFIRFGARHIHHLVLGIIILLLGGYGWSCEAGVGTSGSSIFLSRFMSILYGVGAALTLDEFARWLNLRAVYWSREGRSSIDAIILFGALLAAGAWATRLLRRGKKHKELESWK